MSKDKQRIKWEDLEFPEEHVKNGENYPDKLFYIVRRYIKYEGICSVINSCIGHFLYIEEMKKNTQKEIVPIIDMLHYHSDLWMMDETQNDWELFFEQPQLVYGFNDIEKAQNVLLGSSFRIFVNYETIYFYEDQIKLCNNIYQKYIHANIALKKNIRLWKDKLFLDNRKIIGCFMRMGIAAGKDIEKNLEEEKKKELGAELFEGWNMKYYPDCPTKQEIVCIIRKYLAQWDATHVFVSIDDEETLEYIKEELGDVILSIPRNRPQFYDRGAPKLEIYEKKFIEVEGAERYDRNLGYLTEIYLLSQCQSFLCGRSSGAATAVIINGNQYQHKYYFSSLYRYLDEKSLQLFCSQYTKIYVFGTGNWGTYIANYLSDKEIIYEGFIVSNRHINGDTIMQHPIYQLSKAKLDDTCGVVVGVKSYQTIVTELEKRGIKNYYVIGEV
jgi:hypothetical protein